MNRRNSSSPVQKRDSKSRSRTPSGKRPKVSKTHTKMPAFELPALPWEKNALAAKGISEETIDYHYGKHHQTYVTKLNAAAESDPSIGEKSLEELIKTAGGGVFNNAAQIWNHTFYWNCLSPNGGGEPTGAIADKINEAFGDFATFKTKFSDCAVTHFGSGWAFLIQNGDGKLEIKGYHDADCPVKYGERPILTCDVWEHAYYIDFRNARPKYLDAWWNLVNWEFANGNLA